MTAARGTRTGVLDDDVVPIPEYEVEQYFPDQIRSADLDPAVLRTHYGIVRAYFKLRAERYRDLQRWLNQSRAGVTYDVYLTETVRLALLAGLLGALIGAGATALLAVAGGVPDLYYTPGVVTFPFGVPDPLANTGIGTAIGSVLAANETLVLAAVAAAVMAGLSVVSVWSYRYYAPKSRATMRGRAIDVVLPHAIVYMYALAYGGTNVVEIVRSLAESPDYGAVAEEFDAIARDMDLFGVDLFTALRNARNLTPSMNFEQFLDDTISMLDSGGDLTRFLDREADDYLEEAGESQAEFVETLSMLSEVFVAAFVAAPLLLVVTLMVISFMGADVLTGLYAITYLVFPLGMAGFLLLIDLLSQPYSGAATDPVGTESALDEVVAATRDTVASLRASIARAVVDRWGDDLPASLGGRSAVETDGGVVDPGVGPVTGPGAAVGSPAGTGPATGPAARAALVDDARFPAYRRRQAADALVALLSDPLALFRRQPPLTLVVTVPAAVAVLAGVVATGLAEPSLAALFAEPFRTTVLLFVVPFVVAAVPLSVFHERRVARQAAIEERFPDALNVLSSANQMGIPLTDGLALVARWSSGALADELRTTRNDVAWNYDVRTALVAFGDRLRVPQLRRVVRLIARSGRSSGDLSRVLSVAAEDTRNRFKLERARRRAMGSYIAIVVIGYLVYLFVIVLLSTAYLAPMAALPPVEGATGMPIAVGTVPIEAYRVVFLHSALIQAIGTGLLAGKLADNDATSGLKYSLALVALAVGAFLLT